MSKRKIAKIINDYSAHLSKVIKVDGVFLFGSAVRGTMNEDSDIDLIVISKDFNRMNFLKRLEFLSRERYGTATQVAMDIIGYTPREFVQLAKSDSPNIRRILGEGKRII